MIRVTAAAFACLLLAIPAHAGPRKANGCVLTNEGREICGQKFKQSSRHARANRSDPKPRKWCAWWLRRELGIPRSAFKPWEYNLARAFRYIGRPSGPGVGAIVVWRHHVGVITGRTGKGWVVRSGNDGGRVRERVRSVKGAIAFRRLNQRWAGL